MYERLSRHFPGMENFWNPCSRREVYRDSSRFPVGAFLVMICRAVVVWQLVANRQNSWSSLPPHRLAGNCWARVLVILLRLRPELPVRSMNLLPSGEITMEAEDYSSHGSQPDSQEEGVAVPWDSIQPDTLRNLIAEFVTREWSDLSDAEVSLDTKVEQVLKQLRLGQATVVFDLTAKTCNIILR